VNEDFKGWLQFFASRKKQAFVEIIGSVETV